MYNNTLLRLLIVGRLHSTQYLSWCWIGNSGGMQTDFGEAALRGRGQPPRSPVTTFEAVEEGTSFAESPRGNSLETCDTRCLRRNGSISTSKNLQSSEAADLVNGRP
jgi:hypothetical protein